jgi:2',3'-cyclic-nucleotide 2'-phosphodiesterase (5'-nucleotidase family)
MQRLIGFIFAFFLAVALPGAGYAAGFGSGDVVVLRAGDGSGALSSAAAAVFLDEFTATGSKVQSLPLPTAVSGSNKPLAIAGSSTADGALRRSADGRYLTLSGYAAAPGTAGIAATTSAATNRVVGRVDWNGNIDTTTALSNAFSTYNCRGAVTNDGTAFWAVGSGTGVQYAAYGATTSTQINTAAPTNLRVPGIFNGQLYVSSASGTFLGVGTVGSGLTTATGQTPALLAGFPTSGSHSPYGFFFANANTVYVADDGAITSGGGIQKWIYNGTTWTLAKTMNNGSTGCRGLTGYVSGANVVIYATTTESSANKLVTITDVLSDTTTFPAFTTLATAPANTAFRGVDLAPSSGVPTATVTATASGIGSGSVASNDGSINYGYPASSTGTTTALNLGANVVLTATANTGSTVAWSTCPGTAAGNGGVSATCTISSLTGNTTAAATFTLNQYTLTINTIGNGSGSVSGVSNPYNYNNIATITANPGTGSSFAGWSGCSSSLNPAISVTMVNNTTCTANFTANPINGACGSDNGQTLAATVPANLCSAGSASAVSGNGHPWTWTCAGSNNGSTANCSAAIQTYNVTFASNGNGAVSGATTQTVDFGGSTTPVSADANNSYAFVNWTGNGFTTTTANPLTVNNITANLIINANFIGTITIFHVNDTHARVTPHQWIVTEHKTDTPVFEAVGGAAYLGSEMLQLTAAQPNALVLDGGDVSEGNPIGDMNGNGPITQFYAMLSSKLVAQRGRGVDAVVVGNHDVRDVAYINNLSTLASTGVPVISANVLDITTHQPYFPPYTTVTIGTTKIGILGYTTSASEVGASLSNTLEVAACDWKSTDSTKIHLADYVNELRNNQGCNLVILLAHNGHSGIVDPTAPLLADDGSAKLPEVAVTGHWHTWADTVWQPEMLNYKTIFTESASFMEYIGELHITDTGSYISSVQHVIRDADITPDPDVQTLLNNLTTQYNAANPDHQVYGVIGYTASDLKLDNEMKWWSADEYPWNGNNTAGQWICDAMQWKATQLFGQCDLAIESGGGVRADIPAGPITYMQAYETYPWSDDTYYRVNMTGQDIINFLQKNTMDAGFSSALNVTAFDGIPTSVTFNGQPIDVAHTYTVAISNYMYANPPSGWTWSDTNPLTSTVLVRDSLADYMQQFTAGNPYQAGVSRYSLNTEFSGGYRAVVTMMNDNDTEPDYEYAFIRLISATPETLARLGSDQVPSNLVNADGTIIAANRLSEQELYRSYLGFKTGALKPGDIIETWGKGSFYGGNPEFVDQEGVYGDGVEFKVVGHDASLAKPAFMPSIGAFFNNNSKNHYVQFIAKKTGANTVVDQNGMSLSIMDVTAYVSYSLPGNTGDMLLISGIPTMESYGLRFRCNNAVATTAAFPPVGGPSSYVNAIAPGTTSSTLNLSATASVGSATYSLLPVADSQVESGNPSSNYGTSSNLYVQSSSTSSYGDERAWLKFDLSSIPATATISSVSLQLWNWKSAGAALPTEVHGGTDDSWTQTGITWNNQPTFGAALSTQTLAAGTSNVWYNWDVTSFAQGKMSGDKLVSLVVKAATEGSTDATAPSYAFDSTGYSSDWPVLQVATQTPSATIAQVQYFYRYSSDNATWNSWTPFATVTAAPYATSFSFPQGTGYYEFYSQATDSSNNVQPAPAAAQAATHYTATPAYYPIVSIDSVHQIYDGTAKQVAVTTIPAGASYNVTYNDDYTVPVSAGTYAVSVTASQGGTTVTTTGNLTIAKAAATASFGNLSFTYDGTPKTAGVITNPAGLAVTVTYNGSTTPPTSAGTYAVAAVINDSNYHGGATGTLTITQPVDISSQVNVTTASLVYSRATKLYTGNLTVANTGQNQITGTINVVLNNLTNGVTLTNATGMNSGYPYISRAVSLNPGASFTIPVTFSDPSNAKINFTPVIYQE